MNACKKIQNFLFRGVFVWILFFTSACSGTVAPDSRSSESPIEKNMRDFYNRLGGKSLLGDTISPVLQEGDLYYQFTENVVLVFDPQAPAIKQYHLHPVGLDMGFKEPPEPMPADPKTVYVNGFVIWPEVINLYNRWGRMCKPISALHFDEDHKRFEQFFDCFGVYRSEDEPVGVIHLLDYGTWKCKEACQEYSPTSSSFNSSSSSFIPESLFPEPPTKQDLAAAEANIIIAADRIGRAITGFPLTSTYLSDDGTQYLKIYENVVFAIDRGNSARAYVLAITRSLNIRPGKPKAEIKEPGAKFTPIQGNLGYTVRVEFYNFLALHGSYDTSGAPIMNEYAYNATVNRQCFENICLDYHKKAAGDLKVRPASLGYIYKELYYREELDTPATINAASNVSILTWEENPLISSDQAQEISATVYVNGIYVPDVQLILSVRMPDGIWVDSEPQPTDQNGHVGFNLSPIIAPNSTIIVYRVCLFGIDEARDFCTQEDFLIWGNP